MKVGVLAVQGNFREHAAMLHSLGAEVVEVRLPGQLEGLDGLVIPGGTVGADNLRGDPDTDREATPLGKRLSSCV